MRDNTIFMGAYRALTGRLLQYIMHIIVYPSKHAIFKILTALHFVTCFFVYIHLVLLDESTAEDLHCNIKHIILSRFSSITCEYVHILTRYVRWIIRLVTLI